MYFRHAIICEWITGPKTGERRRLVDSQKVSTIDLALAIARERFPIGQEYASKIDGERYRVVAYEIGIMEK